MENLSEYFIFKDALSSNEFSAGSGSGNALDFRGFDRACYAVNIGTQGGGSVVAQVAESATETGTYTDISSAQQAVPAAGSATAAGTYVIEVPVSGSKPWQHLEYTVATSAVDLSAVAIGYNGSRKLPPSQDNTEVCV